MENIIYSQTEFLEYHTNLLYSAIRRACKSPVYENFQEIDNIEEITKLPLTFWENINEVIKNYGLERTLLNPYEKYWQTSGTTGSPKKIYYGHEDLRKIAKLGSRIAYFCGLRKDDIVWNLGSGDPYMSTSLMHLICKESGLKEIITPLNRKEDMIKALRTISKVEKIDALGGVPAVYLAIARTIIDPEALIFETKEKIKQKIKPFHSLSGIITKAYLRGIDYNKLKKMFRNITKAFLGGEMLSPYKSDLKRVFPQIEFREGYGSTELTIGAIQLSNDEGLSIMLDWFIPELIKPEEVMKAKANPNYKVKSYPWWKWKKGMRGELVITRDGECLPLLRYPTGDLIEVVNPQKVDTINVEEEKLLVKLPAIKILGRSSELVNFSLPEDVATFKGGKAYCKQIKEAMGRAKKYGNVKWWDLYVDNRYIYQNLPFTKFTFEVIPEKDVNNKTAFENEIKQLLREELDEVNGHLKRLEITWPKELTEKLLEVKILDPNLYKKIEEEIRKRWDSGVPLGQLKPKQIHVVS